jgi:hypothetical protein
MDDERGFGSRGIVIIINVDAGRPKNARALARDSKELGGGCGGVWCGVRGYRWGLDAKE